MTGELLVMIVPARMTRQRLANRPSGGMRRLAGTAPVPPTLYAAAEEGSEFAGAGKGDDEDEEDGKAGDEGPALEGVEELVAEEGDGEG